jgi:uncharacterized protein YdcH (DUF465 family)
MGEQEVDTLIIQIEQLDNRIVTLNMGRGMANPKEAQVLKYRRCFLFDKLTRIMNNMPEEDDKEWGEL